MMTILLMALTTLVVINERLNELLINPILEGLVARAVDSSFDWSKVIRYTSFFFGILLGYFFLVPLLQFMAEVAGETAVSLTPMIVVFLALLVGGGSQLLHDVWSVFPSIKARLAATEPAHE